MPGRRIQFYTVINTPSGIDMEHIKPSYIDQTYKLPLFCLYVHTHWLSYITQCTLLTATDDVNSR